jgi:hypothetical protein
MYHDPLAKAKPFCNINFSLEPRPAKPKALSSRALCNRALLALFGNQRDDKLTDRAKAKAPVSHLLSLMYSSKINHNAEGGTQWQRLLAS